MGTLDIGTFVHARTPATGADSSTGGTASAAAASFRARNCSASAASRVTRSRSSTSAAFARVMRNCSSTLMTGGTGRGDAGNAGCSTDGAGFDAGPLTSKRPRDAAPLARSRLAPAFVGPTTGGIRGTASTPAGYLASNARLLLSSREPR